MARALSQAALEEIARLTRLYPQTRSAVMPALYAAQEEIGYLTEGAMADVGEALGLPLTEVMSVATFYEMFHLEPPGRYHIRICTNLSCYLNGCEGVVSHLCARLGIRPGQTTADGRVTLEAVQCLAACEEAPVLLVNAERHARVTVGTIDDLLAGLK
ncbi:MAG TPA: NADH-quinone oxidoreductase subunit NuoE [bacterium]|nr:NADH-quinone oxidoreductase subunit NuoE [bacterium]